MREFVEASPMYGHVTHAIVKAPQNWHHPVRWMMTTYQRALCGVGRGGMRIKLDRETEQAKPWVGIGGCERCAVKVRKIQEGK